MSQLTHCGHGKKYVGEDCPECEAVWLTAVTLPDLIRGCKRAAHFANDNPGLVERDVGRAIAALNATVARLAELLAATDRGSRK
jgi:hypothetical protein